MTEGRGVPTALVISGANRTDMKKLGPLLDAVVVERPAPAQGGEEHLCLDRGYDYADCRTAAAERGYTAHIPPKAGAAQPLPAPCAPDRHPPRRWVVEIILSQLTKPRVEAAFGGRDDIADLHVVIGDHHPVNQQLDQFAALLEGGGLQVPAEPGAHLGHGRQDLSRVDQPLPLREDLALPRGEFVLAVR